jgi:hypothetical protein
MPNVTDVGSHLRVVFDDDRFGSGADFDPASMVSELSVGRLHELV